MECLMEKQNKNIILGGQEIESDEIRNSSFSFSEIKSLQTKLLNAYRMTEEYRKAYCKYIIENYPNGLGVQRAIKEIKRFKNIQNPTIEEHGELITDMMYCLYVLGYQHYEYFCYDFENKSFEERKSFMSNNNIMDYYKSLNKDKNAKKILGNKYLTYLNFKEFFKRDIIKITNNQNKEEFIEFCNKHSKFIIKPINGALGRKIEIIDCNKYKNIDEVFEYLLSLKTEIICEELISQISDFSEIHKESVNTVRIFSYYNGTESSIVCAWLKAGKGKAIVDNGGSGGMLASIDIKNGIVQTDARDESANTYIMHPDTGFVFKDFKIKKWKELLTMVHKMVRKIPGVPMIGWDFALSEEKGWQLIEGNEGGQIFLNQIPLKEGRREQYEKIFEWDKWRKK